jgi:hypothetical protein
MPLMKTQGTWPTKLQSNTHLKTLQRPSRTLTWSFETTDEEYREILCNKIRDVLHKALEETRKVALSHAFKGANSAVGNAASSKEKDGPLFLGDAVQSAFAGCRAAARHAVQHQALNTVINKSNAAYAIEAALHKYRNKCHPQPLADSVFDTFFTAMVAKAKEAASKAFQAYIELAGVEVGTNIAVTADIVARNAARGILAATFEAITEAKNAISSPSPRQSSVDPESQLSETEEEPKSHTNVEETPLHGLQGIKESEIPLIVTDLEGALDAIRSSDIYKSIDPSKNRSLAKRLNYPFTTSAVVLKNQLIDVPRLFSPRGRETTRLQNGGHRNFDSPWRRKHRAQLLVFSSIVGAFYGAIQLTKWKSKWFPTPMEHLWKISCGIGSLAVLPIIVSMILPFIPRRRYIVRRVYVVACTMSWLLFGAARIYFVVESFMFVRSLPSSTYLTVQWSNTIPHI